MKKIFLIIMGCISIVFSDFERDDTSNIVTDNRTELQWQDNQTIKMTWLEAIEYCEVFELGGHTDWRLPNLKELYSLVDDTKVNPSISNIFQHTFFVTIDKNIEKGYYFSQKQAYDNAYFSSTTLNTISGSSESVWSISFYDGLSTSKNKNRDTYNNKAYVRCVRSSE